MKYFAIAVPDESHRSFMTYVNIMELEVKEVVLAEVDFSEVGFLT